MIKIKKLSIPILVGFAIGVFIIQPLGITILNYGNQANEINWLQYLKSNLVEILNINGNQIVENILFGLLGASVALIFYLGKMEKNIDNK
ncbi:hypothetical protein MWU76_12190 [Gelidibacter sp. F2691]|nr:hypothetical protein [Gelidibacter sp. F2691]